MTFTDPLFIVRFLPILIICFFIVPRKFRNLVMLVASIVFACINDWKTAILLFVLTCLNYPMLRFLNRLEGKKRKAYFVFMIILDSCPLLFFKYFTGAIECMKVDGLVMPLGISFYTFMLLSVVADTYNGVSVPTNALEFGTYMFFFPKLIEGPIAQYKEMRSDLQFGFLIKEKNNIDTQSSELVDVKNEEKTYMTANIERNAELFIIGFAFKVLIADRIATLWNYVESIGIESISTPMAYLGMIAYSMQLYFDFAGYSYMAMGIAGIFGYTLPRNFDHPYASRTISEFYRRWHATLGRWFKEYIYIPLGGSRVGSKRMIFNLAIVWLLTGIWHGVTWNFLLWAGILLLFIIIEKLYIGEFLNKHKVISKIYVWAIIPVTWIVFAISDMRELALYLGKLFPFGGCGHVAMVNDFIYYGKDYIALIIGAFIISLPKVEEIFVRNRDKLWMKILMFILFWICIYYASIGQNNPFLYSNF